MCRKVRVGQTHLLPTGGRGDDGWEVLAVQSAGPDRDDQDVQDPEWCRTMASAAVLVATAVQNVRVAREVE